MERVSKLKRLVLVEIPSYTTRNRAALLRYLLVYIALWGLEWGLGLSMETSIALSITALVALEGAAFLLRGSWGALSLALLRERELAKKKRSKLQRL